MPLQVLRIGQLAITTAPGEFTIVAGQRVLDAVTPSSAARSSHQILAGYANAYAGYVATPEEYDAQNYEGAATHFGRYTGPAYAQELAEIWRRRCGTGGPPRARRSRSSLADQRISVRPGVVLDTPPLGKSFGSVITQPAASYPRGAAVRADFVTGHPNNNLRDEGTFVEVQRQAGGQWRRCPPTASGRRSTAGSASTSSVSTAQITWTDPGGRARRAHTGSCTTATPRA